VFLKSSDSIVEQLLVDPGSSSQPFPTQTTSSSSENLHLLTNSFILSLEKCWTKCTSDYLITVKPTISAVRIFESNRIVTSVFNSIQNEHNYLKFSNTYCDQFLTYLTE